MRYLDGIKTDAPTDADNALILGTAAHTGLEQGLDEALHEYAFSFPIITDEHINEMLKLEVVIPKARAALPAGGQFEVSIMDRDFIGFIDYLLPVEEFEGIEFFDLYDFKYAGNPSNYRNSPQLSLYKYFFERCNPGKKIRKMYFFFIPKVKIKPKKAESLLDFRNRLQKELEKAEVKISYVQYDVSKVLDFLFQIKAAQEETEFPKAANYLCRYCEYQDYCEKGWDYFMKLPENKRRSLETAKRRVIWIYGAPFCGKTTFANGFPDPLMLNTDGNIKFVDAPYIHIKDEVKVEGRMTKRTLAWEIFKDTVAELEKKDNTFKTIVVDLLEDMYEHCRVYMYQQMGITHESDDSFRAWDKVRGEFLHTLRRLMNLDYENIILISHEDTTRDLTRKSGDKISAIKPNLPDKVAVKVAGMVDVVARIVADGDTHSFCFKSNETIFGGGRLKVNAKDIPLDVDALFAVYDEANKNASGAQPGRGYTPDATTGRSSGRRKKDAQETPATASYKAQDEPEAEQAGNDTPAEEAPQTGAESVTEEAAEAEPEAPRRRRKKVDTPAEDQEAKDDADRAAAGDPAMPQESKVNPADMVECPDAERIFQQYTESNGKIPLCPNIDAAHKCHKYNAPAVSCPLLDRPKENPQAATADAAPTQDAPAEDKPRRRRKARD